MESQGKIAVVLCAVLEDEFGALAGECERLGPIVKMEQGLHNEPDRLRRELQAAIDRVEAEHPDVGAIVLGYGLCSRGTEGVRTSRALLVVPRAHDCITLLLGDRRRYADYVARHPGTYWYSPGWNRHHVPPGPERHRLLREEYVRKYGEDNADYLMEMEQGWFQTYDRATYVHQGPGFTEQDVEYTRRCAEWLGWQCDVQVGDPRLIRMLLRGEWSEEEFLVLRPGQALRMTADDRVIEASDEDRG
ncbi:MAG: DUF1638 domain-containing protein [Armatimonadetes bacterium]|jgi:hypothetical protein|nr:DUF1638 domain-containing protein [Armatimonadota bacterium]